MPFYVSASDVTETIKTAAQANGAIAQATRAANGIPVAISRTAPVTMRPLTAISAVIKSSSASRRIGFASPSTASSGLVELPKGIVSAHTGTKSTIAVSGASYDLYTFLNVGTNTFVVSDLPITVDIFVLGGGGGGYRYNSGRGGSFTVASNVTLTPRSYTLTVGGGGGGGRANLGQYGSPGGSSSITVSGITYTGAGGSDGGGTGANGPTSDFTGVVTNYGGQGANGGAPGAGGGGTFGAGMFGGGGSGTNGLGGGGGAVHDDMNWGGSGGSGRVMIRVRK